MKLKSNQMGNYLRTLRQQRGVSMYKLAVQVNKVPTFISLVERGKRGINLYDLWRVVTELNGDYGTAVRLAILDAGVPREALEALSSNPVGEENAYLFHGPRQAEA